MSELSIDVDSINHAGMILRAVHGRLIADAELALGGAVTFKQ